MIITISQILFVLWFLYTCYRACYKQDRYANELVNCVMVAFVCVVLFSGVAEEPQPPVSPLDRVHQNATGEFCITYDGNSECVHTPEEVHQIVEKWEDMHYQTKQNGWLVVSHSSCEWGLHYLYRYKGIQSVTEITKIPENQKTK